jgi:hypothetical protein
VENGDRTPVAVLILGSFNVQDGWPLTSISGFESLPESHDTLAEHPKREIANLDSPVRLRDVSPIVR